jgi:hypothetical protein
MFGNKERVLEYLDYLETLDERYQPLLQNIRVHVRNYDDEPILELLEQLVPALAEDQTNHDTASG